MSKGLICNQYVSDKKKERSRELRKTMTPAEHIFWDMVRNGRLNNHKFRRQQVIKGFIVDFYCDELHLCVEIDGKIHERADRAACDSARDAVLRQKGLKVLRITNDEVLNNSDKVKKMIERI